MKTSGPSYPPAQTAGPRPLSHNATPPTDRNTRLKHHCGDATETFNQPPQCQTRFADLSWAPPSRISAQPAKTSSTSVRSPVFGNHGHKREHSRCAAGLTIIEDMGTPYEAQVASMATSPATMADCTSSSPATSHSRNSYERLQVSRVSDPNSMIDLGVIILCEESDADLVERSSQCLGYTGPTSTEDALLQVLSTTLHLLKVREEPALLRSCATFVRSAQE